MSPGYREIDHAWRDSLPSILMATLSKPAATIRFAISSLIKRPVRRKDCCQTFCLCIACQFENVFPEERFSSAEHQDRLGEIAQRINELLAHFGIQVSLGQFLGNVRPAAMDAFEIAG